MKEIDEGLEHALAALPRFPNLDSIEIYFTPECKSDHEVLHWEHVLEDSLRREDVLTLVFRAIKDQAADEKIRTIRKLIIINLQNYRILRLTSSISSAT